MYFEKNAKITNNTIYRIFHSKYQSVDTTFLKKYRRSSNISDRHSITVFGDDQIFKTWFSLYIEEYEDPETSSSWYLHWFRRSWTSVQMSSILLFIPYIILFWNSPPFKFIQYTLLPSLHISLGRRNFQDQFQPNTESFKFPRLSLYINWIKSSAFIPKKTFGIGITQVFCLRTHAG